ncbi:MAG: 4-(cytidine 5'-diphospho)-2-C-methyl-D-erythritol kinase [Elusimicrobiota bacterium]|jgi:4-diphosphocytidyl-2-C-methyl-D-erythritol kinase
MIRLAAPAKVNFFLEITGKRPDGYHTLSTLFQTISLTDELTFASADELFLRCSDTSLQVNANNLVMRAAVGLRALLKERRGARIHLTKRVPTGAGLGGGSSDAATTLIGLCRLWRRRPSEAALHRLATSLGADVPFFLKKGLCLAGGIGDRLRPLPPLPKMWMVLVYPGFGVSTKEAYGKVKLPFTDLRHVPSPAALATLGRALPQRRGTRGATGNCGSPVVSLNRERGMTLSRRLMLPPPAEGEGWGESTLFNRFETFIFPGHPELPQLKQRLLDAGCAAALMSGSGSSVFGLVPSSGAGRRVLTAIRKTYPQSWLVHTAVH